MDFRNAAVLIALVSVGFVVGFSFMPESPQWLIAKQRGEEAEVAYKYLRGLGAKEALPEHLAADFSSIQSLVTTDSGQQTQLKQLLKHFAKPGVLKGVFIAIVVSFFPQMSGCYVLITFNQGIFKAADVTVLSVFWSSLAFAFIQIIAALLAAKFVDRVGRRKILIGSGFSSAFCLAIFGGYMYVKTQTNVDLMSISGITWIPLISLLVQVFVSSIGIIPGFYFLLLLIIITINYYFSSTVLRS